ncbi:hypothetical protein VP14_177 [Vibrio phage VPMCC14]|nr:hypothetical protein VP14_177 [Vibrio phage VPMCC14]
MKITSKFYLDYVNNFLTVDYFAEYYNFTKDQALSVIARSKTVWLSEDVNNRKYFSNNNLNLCDHYHNMSKSNQVLFTKLHNDRLLAEFSA